MNVKQQQILIGILIGLIVGAGVGYMYSSTGPTDTSDVENEISILQNQIAQLESQKAIIETQLSNVHDDIQGSTDALEELLSEYNSLSSEFEEYKDKTEEVDVSSYEDTIDALENQIVALNSEIETLQTIIPPINTGEWNEIATFSGMGSLATDYFFVPELEGVELKISWINYGSDSDKWINSINIYEQGAEWHYEYLLLPELMEGSLIIHAPIPTGQTYLDVDTWIHQESQWEIVIEALIP